MADLFLCCRRVLELRWSGTFRLLHQPAHCAVLHARAEYHSSPRAHSALRRLWNAGSRLDALLSSRSQTWQGMEEWAAFLCLLVDQHRTCSHGSLEHAADRLDAG